MNRSKSMLEKQKYCSRLCMFSCPLFKMTMRVAKSGEKNHNYGKRFTKEHKEKIAKAHRGKIVSQETREKFRAIMTGKRGKNSPAYKENSLSPVIKRCRDLTQYTEWRTSVFKRDNYTCQICFQVSGVLNADHIKRFADIFRENNLSSVEEAIECKDLWDISNGRTLCKECHLKTPNYGWKPFNNKNP